MSAVTATVSAGATAVMERRTAMVPLRGVRRP